VFNQVVSLSIYINAEFTCLILPFIESVCTPYQLLVEAALGYAAVNTEAYG
jgi:hypothetical protein